MDAVELFTPDQEEIRQVARQFLSQQAGTGWLREWIDGDGAGGSELWRQIAELGWLGITVSEELGGAGYGSVERAILLEEMGRVLLPLPFFSSTLAADLLSATGTEPASELLAELASGSRRATVAAYGDLLSQSDPSAGLAAERDGAGWRLQGEARAVLDAIGADVLLAVADAANGTGVFVVEATAELRMGHVALVDATRPAAAVSFSGTPAMRLDSGREISTVLEEFLSQASVSLAAETIGAADRCLEMTLAYVKDREQFGVAIGSFQALKHRLADLYVMVDAARQLVYASARAATTRDRASRRTIAAAAKLTANRALLRATEETIQMHGGIGFTWEHDAHLYYKRALVATQILGSTVDQLDRVAVGLGA